MVKRGDHFVRADFPVLIPFGERLDHSAFPTIHSNCKCRRERSPYTRFEIDTLCQNKYHDWLARYL